MTAGPLRGAAIRRLRISLFVLCIGALAWSGCAEDDRTVSDDAVGTISRADQGLTKSRSAAGDGVLGVATKPGDASRDDPSAWRIVEPIPDAQQASVDHSDILLMLQGCTCISPNCVAYLCPVDVVESIEETPDLGLRVRPSAESDFALIRDLLRQPCPFCVCVKAEGCPCCGYGDLGDLGIIGNEEPELAAP